MFLAGCGGENTNGENGNNGTDEIIENDTINGSLTIIKDSTDIPDYPDTLINAQLFLEATLDSSEPSEGVEDGGWSTAVFIYIKDTMILEERRYEIGDPNFFWILEEIIDPGGYDLYYPEDLVGHIEILDYGESLKAMILVQMKNYADSTKVADPVIFD